MWGARLAASLVVGALVATATPAQAADATRCTAAEESAFNTLANFDYMRCENFVRGFEVCDDGCLKKITSVVDAAPNCTVTLFSDVTKKQQVQAMLTKCEAARASTADKYTPTATPGVAECTFKEEDNWSLKYGTSTAYGTCVSAMGANTTCTSECLSTIEEGVSQAPVCLNSGDYSMREIKKMNLVQCIKSRGESLKANKVLQSSSGTASGSSSSTAATTPTASSQGNGLYINAVAAVGMAFIVLVAA